MQALLPNGQARASPESIPGPKSTTEHTNYNPNYNHNMQDGQEVESKSKELLSTPEEVPEGGARAWATVLGAYVPSSQRS